jgi:hypothetical protein
VLLSSQMIVDLNVRGIFKLARLYVYVTIYTIGGYIVAIMHTMQLGRHHLTTPQLL